MTDPLDRLLFAAFQRSRVLVQACHELAKRHVKVRLFVAGDGDLLPGLKTLSELGVADRGHWLGSVADPKTLLQASDIFLLPSVGEAFGLVLAEAMACGVADCRPPQRVAQRGR